MNVFSLREWLNMNSNKISHDMLQKLQRQRGYWEGNVSHCHSVINFISLSRAEGLPWNDLRPENSFPLTYHPRQRNIISASSSECWNGNQTTWNSSVTACTVKGGLQQIAEGNCLCHFRGAQSPYYRWFAKIDVRLQLLSPVEILTAELIINCGSCDNFFWIWWKICL